MTARYVACPLCKAEGRDSTGNHLKLFEDGKAGWCIDNVRITKYNRGGPLRG